MCLSTVYINMGKEQKEIMKDVTRMEAKREILYRNLPVPEDWHEDYARGKATTENYRQ